MNVDFLEILQSAMGAGFVREVSAQLGESELAMHTAVRCAGPTLISGLMQRAATPGGASEIYRQVTDPQIDATTVAKFPRLIANQDSLESLLRLGEGLDHRIFGARTAAVTHALAESSGVRTSSALTILSLTAPILFGLLKKHTDNNGLDASSLGELLLRQQHTVGRSGLDHRVAGAMGYGSVAEMLAMLPERPSSPGRAAKKAPRVSERPWLPWSAAAAIAIFGVVFLVNRTAEQQELPRGAVKVAEMDAAAPAARPVRQSAPATNVSAAGDAAVSDPDDQREFARDRARASREAEQPPGDSPEPSEAASTH